MTEALAIKATQVIKESGVNMIKNAFRVIPKFYKSYMESQGNLEADDKEISKYENITKENRGEKESSRFDTEKHNAPFLNSHKIRVVNASDKLFGDVDGYTQLKDKLLANNENMSKGHFAEIARAMKLKKIGYDTEAFGAKVPMLKNTDIDILARNSATGESMWVENKQVGNISLDDKFKRQIDNMQLAKKSGVVLKDGSFFQPDKAVFVNSGDITQSAKEYASSRGVEIADNMKNKSKKFENFIRGDRN